MQSKQKPIKKTLQQYISFANEKQFEQMFQNKPKSLEYFYWIKTECWYFPNDNNNYEIDQDSVIYSCPSCF